MFDLMFSLFSSLSDWQKALIFSFISYSMVLMMVIVAVTFILRDFKFTLIAGICSIYMFSLIAALFVASKLFNKNLANE